MGKLTGATVQSHNFGGYKPGVSNVHLSGQIWPMQPSNVAHEAPRQVRNLGEW